MSAKLLSLFSSGGGGGNKSSIRFLQLDLHARKRLTLAINVVTAIFIVALVLVADIVREVLTIGFNHTVIANQKV